MSNINQIGHHLGKDQSSTVYMNCTDKEKGEILSDLLVTICEAAEEVDVLTGGVSVDIDYLLGVEGSYIIGIREGELPPETLPPATLYEESLFPSLENAKGIETQVVEEESVNGEPTTNTVDEGYATEDTTNQGT